jgi:hypothetical protein
MKPITAADFVETWKEFSQEFTKRETGWIDAYESATEWSRLFLGSKRCVNNGSPIGDEFKEKHPELYYRTEDGSFDISFFSAPGFQNIPSLTRLGAYLEVDRLSYPVAYDILVEIENSARDAWREMTKMTWVQCRLKVVVTYFHKHSGEEELLRQSFQSIISQSNPALKENPDTEYLLLIGNNEGKQLNWKSFIFNSEGTQK